SDVHDLIVFYCGYLRASSATSYSAIRRRFSACRRDRMILIPGTAARLMSEDLAGLIEFKAWYPGAKFARFSLSLNPFMRRDRPIVEFDRGDHSQREESEQDHELGDLEWRVVLRRRDFLQRGKFLEQLHDEHKYVQVKSQHHADDVTFAPAASELTGI